VDVITANPDGQTSTPHVAGVSLNAGAIPVEMPTASSP